MLAVSGVQWKGEKKAIAQGWEERDYRLQEWRRSRPRDSLEKGQASERGDRGVLTPGAGEGSRLVATTTAIPRTWGLPFNWRGPRLAEFKTLPSLQRWELNTKLHIAGTQEPSQQN